MGIKRNSLTGGLFAMPWCCIVPAGFSLLGLAGVTAARTVFESATPFFILVSLFFLGRAHYLISVKKYGNRLSHVVTWISTVVAVSVWGWQWVV
ncbi:hypothetical protein MNBD_NITROSPIRAE01-440 [hydrothermal vent metagenome]|uniref:Uncharacterized protein n=1 Tax=hydrothermal vent metagenome TaxID=652676 RepID=A0A3B1DHT5_9ZZZZ